MTRAKIFIAALSVAIALPTAASAHCGTTQGSFAVTCEKGVQVYRHQALSPFPRGLSRADAQLEVEKMRQETAQMGIAANARAQAANAKLREREIAIQDYRARVYDRNTRGQSYVSYGGGYGYGSGFAGNFGSSSQLARPAGFNENRANRRNSLRSRSRFNTRAGRDAGGRNTAARTSSVQATSSNRASGSRLVTSRRGAKKSVKKH